MENSTDTIVVKLTYDGQMRRFPFQGKSFSSLYEQIVSLLSLEKTTELVLKYSDEEGDLITISSDLELKSALVPGQFLRLVVFKRISDTFVPQAQVNSNANPFERGCGGGAMWDHRRRGHASEAEKAMFKQHKKERKLFKHYEKHAGKHHGHHGHPGGMHDQANWRQDVAAAMDVDTATGNIAHHHHPIHINPAAHPVQLDYFGPHGYPALHGHFGPHPPPPPPFAPHHPGHAHHPGHVDPRTGYPALPPHCERLLNPKCDRLFARFVQDVSVTDGTIIPASTSFVKTWRLRNEGASAWPAGSKLLFVGKHSDKMDGPDFVEVEPVAPGGEVDVSVNLCSPAKSGSYTGYWRMCTAEDKKFGQRVWVSIVVPSALSSSDEESEFDHLETLVNVLFADEQIRNFGVKRHRVFGLLQKCDGDVEKVREKLHKKIAKKLKKSKN